MAAPKSQVTETKNDSNSENQSDNAQEPELDEQDDLKQNDQPKEWTVEQCDLSQMFNGYLNEAQILDLRSLREYKKCHIHTAIHVDPQDVESAAIGPKRDSICFDVMGSGYGQDDYKKVYDRCRKLKNGCTFKMAQPQFDFAEFQSIFPHLCVSSDDEQQPKESSQRMYCPNLILPNELYLGDMWDRKRPESLKQLGITHIVDATMETFEEDDSFEIDRFSI